jgi:MoaA/NifB/PqqE/SkfB family radical SAM enzyme
MTNIDSTNWDRNSSGEIIRNTENVEKLKPILNAVGPGFCLAKFTQVSLHLGTGLVHSCHHPTPHKIPLDELEKNPAALFNTAILKSARSEMLTGGKPSECDYCWRIEKNGGTSDRHHKSLEPWALDNFENVISLSGKEFIKPTYLEVSFGNTCNLACAYCGPEFSSKWVEELKQQGPIIIRDSGNSDQWAQGWQDLENLSYLNREHNPYVEAFWSWFPEIYPTLKHFRITGGEPLLNKNTMKSLDYIIENPRPDLELSINTNLSVPDAVWDRFLNKIITLEKSSKFKKITIFTSFEGWEERATYSRHGLDFQKLISRFEELLEKTGVRCVVMATYNILAITSFQKVLEWILDLKARFNKNHYRTALYEKTGYDFTNSVKNIENSFRVGIDVPYLRHPEWLDVMYCSDELFEKYMFPTYEFMAKNTGHTEVMQHYGFEPVETSKFERIVMNRAYFLKKGLDDSVRDDIVKNRSKFYDFINQLDSRRNTDFAKTYPEMENFYKLCKENRNLLK